MISSFYLNVATTPTSTGELLDDADELDALTFYFLFFKTSLSKASFDDADELDAPDLLLDEALPTSDEVPNASQKNDGNCPQRVCKQKRAQGSI